MSETNTVSPPRSLTTMRPFFRELSVNRETASALLDGLTAEQLAWQPAEDEWSLADICSHLTSATTRFLPALDDAIRRGHADAAYSDRPFRGNVVSRLLVWTMEPPVRVRMRTPRMLRPHLRDTPEHRRQLYRTAQGAFELRLERAAGLDLAHVHARVPAIVNLSFSLGTLLAMLLAHERRHLWQATVVRQSPAFPAPTV